MKLTQAVGTSQRTSAYRMVGTQRIIIEQSENMLRVLTQHRHQRRWLLDEQEERGIYYLNGVLRGEDGSWMVATADLAALARVAPCLPLRVQELLLPDSDDWYPLESVEERNSCPG